MLTIDTRLKVLGILQANACGVKSFLALHACAAIVGKRRISRAVFRAIWFSSLNLSTTKLLMVTYRLCCITRMVVSDSSFCW